MVHGAKKCNLCGQFKVLTEFRARASSWDGRAARCTECSLRTDTRRKHGMTRAQRDEIAREQGGCLICKRTEPGGKGWVVDHDHACCPGERSCPDCRRGVLCQWCNSALGYAMDDPTILRAMADYIEAHRSNRSLDRSPNRSHGQDGRTD